LTPRGEDTPTAGADSAPESVVATLDLGNTRGKARLWCIAPGAAPERLRDVALEVSSGLGARLGAWLAEGERPRLVALSSVADPALEAEVAEAVDAAGGELLVAPSPGIENRCRHPETTGLDRLYAARGALEVAGRSAIVVDAGTALTVDAVVRSPAGGGELLGGAIAPGPDLGARALARETARLPHVACEPGVPALGRDTEEAIRAGLVVGFRGAARALVEGIAAEAGLEGAPVALTGGARALLLEPTPFVEAELLVAPGLVHLGLLRAGLAAARGAPRDAR